MEHFVPFCAIYVVAFLAFVVTEQDHTIIQNKNINIIVNLSPKEVAVELFKVLEGRLFSNLSRRSMNAKNTLRELENTVTPLVSPSRRGGAIERPSIMEIANELDQITRTSLTRDFPMRNSLDEEILARDIVAEMMVALKKVLRDKVTSEVEDALVEHSNDRVGSRRMHESYRDIPDESFDDAFTMVIKIRRKDIERIVKSIDN